MRRIRRLISSGAAGIALATVMTLLASPSAGAVKAAGGTTVYVDDNGAECPGPSTYPNLQAAQAALGSTKTNVSIIVCSGLYLAPTSQVIFDGYTNLKITGKGRPVFFLSEMTGALIMVTSSSKVTISGLIISGGRGLGLGAATAIVFINTSGSIKKNLIADWHQPLDTTLTDIDYGIQVVSTDPAKKVAIDHNTINSPQSFGIFVFGPAKSSVTHNRITFYSDLINVPLIDSSYPAAQAGILLYQAGPGVKVSANVIESNHGLEPQPCDPCLSMDQASRGIMLLETSGAAVSGNTVSYTEFGISVESWCYGGTTSQANSNSIRKNKLYNNGDSVYIHAHNFSGAACPTQANGNKVQGNKMSTDLTPNRVLVDAVLPDTAAGNIITGNTFTGNSATTAIASAHDGVSGLVRDPNHYIEFPLTGAP